MPPTSTSSTSLNKPPIDTSNANPQQKCLLFAGIPGEIRNHIFELALAANSGKREPFEKTSYDCRPGFRYADQKIDTALLCTCRRIYQEAYLIPFKNHELVMWSSRLYGPLAPRNDSRILVPWLISVHLFADQFWLEHLAWQSYAEFLAGAAKDLRNLKITIRYCDWSKIERNDLLVLDAKQGGIPWPTRLSKATDEFAKLSWGTAFLLFQGLKKFELELETVEEKRKELDNIVIRAADWRFPLKDGYVLVSNPARTKKSGWHGLKNSECFASAERTTLETGCHKIDTVNRSR